jgi:hypothetical protein
VAAAALACVSSVVCAQGVPIEDDDLADVWGQAMFSVDNRAAAGFDFTRITLNADLKLNANFSNIKAGPLGNPVVDIGELRFVSSGAGDSLNYVQLADPYIELVYKNQTSALTEREIIGARIGFGSINGNLGTLFNKLQGNILITNGMGAGSDAGDLSLNQAAGATSNFACTGTGSGCVNGSIAMSQVGHVQASGPTDFFISLLSQGVSNFGDGTTSTAPEGIAVNWTQGLSYKNITGVVLANPLPRLDKRQGG